MFKIKPSYFLFVGVLLTLQLISTGSLAQARSVRETLEQASGGFLGPTRAFQADSGLEHHFDPYHAFNVRYKALTGEDYLRETYDRVNSQEFTPVSCDRSYSHLPRLREISMIVMVIGDDYTGRLFLCLLEQHLKRGTRVNVMVGGFQTAPPIFARLHQMAREYPTFQYRVHNGIPYSMIGKINLAIHVKSFLTIGEDSKDSILITGGRNLSDRYYFPNFPRIDSPFHPEEEHVFYTDLEVSTSDPKVVDDAYRNHLAIWHRLNSNYSWDLRVPLETQLKILDVTQPLSHLRKIEKQFPGVLKRVEDGLYILRPLTQTLLHKTRAFHWNGVKLIPRIREALDLALQDGFDLSHIYRLVGEANFQPAESLTNESPLMQFRQTLRTRLSEKLVTSGFYQTLRQRLTHQGFGPGEIPTYEKWIDGLMVELDRMMYSKNFEMLSDFEYLFRDNFLDSRNLSSMTIQNIVSMGFGKFWDSKNEKLLGPQTGVLQNTGINDYVYERFYRNEQPISARSESFVRHNFSHAGQDGRFFEKTLVQLIDASTRTIRIVNCFYNPTRSIREALNRAAARGVKVYITTNTLLTKDDLVTIPEQANRKAINAQVTIENITFYDYDGFILHPKLYVFDDEVSYIGSVNMNKRTMRYNNESGLFIADRAFTQNLLDTLWKTQFTPADPDAQVFGKSKLISKAVKSHGFFARLVVFLLGHLM